jgi:hypothetical protein
MERGPNPEEAVEAVLDSLGQALFIPYSFSFPFELCGKIICQQLLDFQEFFFGQIP